MFLYFIFMGKTSSACREPGKILFIPDHIGDGGRSDVSGPRHRSAADSTAPSQKGSTQPSHEPSDDDVDQRRNPTAKRVRG